VAVKPVRATSFLLPRIKTEAAMQKTIDEPDTSELTFPYDMGLIVDPAVTETFSMGPITDPVVTDVFDLGNLS
jgi:hypothetical protein